MFGRLSRVNTGRNDCDDDASAQLFVFGLVVGIIIIKIYSVQKLFVFNIIRNSHKL